MKCLFSRLSKEFHPDLNRENEAALRKFKEIAAAYEILSNPEQRTAYDEQLGVTRYGFRHRTRKEIAAAYEILSNPEQRRACDEQQGFARHNKYSVNPSFLCARARRLPRHTRYLAIQM